MNCRINRLNAWLLVCLKECCIYLNNVFFFVVVVLFNVSLLCPCRLWESLLALAFSCWLPLPSSSWPLPSYSAASASAAKAMMTHCQPKKHHLSWHREPLQGWAYLFLSFFTPFTFFFPIPPALKAFFFFGLNLHQPKPLGDPLLCMREAWQKSDPTCLTQGREVQGSKVSGHETR